MTQLAGEEDTVDEGSEEGGEAYGSNGYAPDIEGVFVGRIHNLMSFYDSGESREVIN